MKKTIVTLVALLLAGFIHCSAASAPIGAEGSNDTISAIDYTGLSNRFNVFPAPSLGVNENEVKAGLLYDVVNNRIVWEKNLNSAFPIASLTKMMVALLTIEDINAGKFKWTDNIQWVRTSTVGTRRHHHTVSSTTNYSLQDVFKATMIASNNECAEQMARYIGSGDLQASINRMNQRARELGMLTTFYGNPTGLPSPNWMYDNSATPLDLLRLTVEMLKYQEILDIAKMGYATIENGKSTSVIRNHNRLTIDFSGEVDGLKTGYTRRAGFCLVATTAKCDRRLVSIVLGCRGPQIRNEVVRDMINSYYTSVGLDPLGPFCPSPLLPNPNLAKTNPIDLTNGQFVTITDKVKKIHIVRRGENLSSVASKYNCTLGQLKSWNKGKINNSRLLLGQKLAVFTVVNKKVFVAKPANGSEEEDDKPLLTDSEIKEAPIEASAKAEVAVVAEKPCKVEKTPNAPVVAIRNSSAKPKFIYHTIEPGDTLFSIARRYDGVTVAELKTLNHIHDIHSLKPGMKIKVKVQI